MIRIEDTKGFNIRGNVMKDMLVTGGAPYNFCTDFHKGAGIDAGDDRELANLRGISVAAVSGYEDDIFQGNDASIISQNQLTNFTSEFAIDIVGIDIQGN